MKSLLLVLSSAFVVGCHPLANDSSRAKLDQPSQQASVKTINAILQPGRSPLFSQWVSQRLGESHTLIRIQMLSSALGWSATSEGILFTSENAQDWRQIRTVPMPKDAYLTDLFFLDSDTGWISLSRSELRFQESTKDGHYEIASWLMGTTDRGRSWQRSFSFEGAQIFQVLFVNEKEGWAVGRRPSRNADETDSNFVINTIDEGKTWQNLSDKLPADIGVYRVASLGSQGVAVITGNGVLYSSANGGSNWHRISSYRNEYNEVAVHQFGVNKTNRLCVLEGSGGIEGTLSILSCPDANNNWTRHVIGGIFLNDVVFLPNGRILACGFIARSSDPLGLKRESAILVSDDEGKNWSIAYRNPEVKSLNALAATDPNNIWAVGANGLMVRLVSSLDSSNH